MIPRFRILARDGFRCVYCGATPGEAELHVDHRQPRSRGGSDHPTNLVTACRACNLSKAAIEPEWHPCTPPDNYSSKHWNMYVEDWSAYHGAGHGTIDYDGFVSRYGMEGTGIESCL